MYKEFVIDPGLLSSYGQLARYLDTCGWDKGKIVCIYPTKGWRRMVYDSCIGVGDREKKKIEQLLASHPFCKRKGTVQSDGTQPWLYAAKREHSRKTFTAILSDVDESDCCVIDGTYLSESNNPRWAPPSRVVPRCATDFARAVSLLCQNCHRIVIVDPNFDCSEPRFAVPLLFMLKEATRDDYRRSIPEETQESSPSIELHVMVKKHFGNAPDIEGAARWLQGKLTSGLPQCIPSGVALRVRLWHPMQEGGEKAHNRYFLTDLGGLVFPIGLDVSSNSAEHASETDDISFLSKELNELRLDQYRPGSSRFNYFDDLSITVTGANSE